MLFVEKASWRRIIEQTVVQIVKFISYKARYLPYKYSHQAAVATILAVNLYITKAGKELGLTQGLTSEEV